MSISEKYFALTDLMSVFIWLIFLSILTFYKASKIEVLHDKKLYLVNFYYKVFFSLLFAISYLTIYGGGDSSVYWDGAECIQNLLFQNPIKGIEHLFSSPTSANYNSFFSIQTGHPPFWIYSESESYFVSKITAIVGLLTFNSYLSTTCIFAFLFANANWKIYQITKKINYFNTKYVSYATLFIPSVSFWCSGISKDTIILISFFYSFYYLFIILSQKNLKIRYFISLFFYLLLIYNTREFMLITVMFPLLIIGIVFINKKIKFSPIIKIPYQIMSFASIITISVYFLSTDSTKHLFAENSFIQEAIVIQNDFKYNKHYGKNKYSIGDEIDYSPSGIVSSMPKAIFAGIFEPLPWNGLSSALIINALESTLFLFLVFRLLLFGNFIAWARTIFSSEILTFCIVFVLLIAFIAGFTSILFGVLVRIRAPLLPFFALLLLVKVNNKQIETEIVSNP